MSKGNAHRAGDMQHYRIGGNTGYRNPGVFEGIKYVKKARMWVKYKCFNGGKDGKSIDQFEWSIEKPT